MEILEKWLNKNRELLSEQVIGLFEDSIACYHANIVRPAYILSYQAMMVHLKNVIINSTTPPAFPPREWQAIINELNNDTKWEARVFTCTQQKNDASTGKLSVLNIPNDIRPRFSFWRDVRNDCAHYKASNVIKAHVLALWSFIEQYLLTFTVEGGKSTLLGIFDDFFNTAKTAPNADIRPLVEKISTMVRQDELQSFFPEYQTVVLKYNPIGIEKAYKDILDNSRDMVVKKELISYIQKEKALMQAMIRIYPEMVLDLYTDPVTIRELWYKDFSYLANSSKIFVLLLSSGRIPSDQIEEACTRVLSIYYTNNTYIQCLTNEEVNILKTHRYLNYFISTYMSTEMINNSAKFGELCYKTDFYISHIQYIDIDETLIRKLIELFTPSSPYILASRVKEYLNNLPELSKQTIREILTQNNLTLPNCITLT